ncbi:pyridoxal phosphate-dependent decarboxylase family protein [Cesiribacter andamanensis]|nr:pyridoxal-dependent decarboxylase [Cesiribacter andamanensis]
MTELLKKAYDAEEFRTAGHALIDQLANYLNQAYQGKGPKVLEWKSPEEQLAFWQNYAPAGNAPTPSTKLFADLLQHSIHLHHKQYMGHQVAPPLPHSALASLLSALMNNGMAVYEMGPAASALEKVVAQTFTRALGWGEAADGFLTSGGTLANLTGLLSARRAKAGGDVWNRGNSEKLALMVSAEAHYCVDRAVRIMGWGEEGVIKVPVNERLQMRTDLLEAYYQQARQAGIRVIAVVGSACSTSSGSYDDLEAISRFCRRHDLWMHVDGAHGGGAIFSPTYRHLLTGVDGADSVVIDIHKMLMAPSITTLLLYKEGLQAYHTFSQKAQYLWEQSGDEEWYNLAKRTFECTKHMMSARVFTILHLYGTQVFDDYVTTLYTLGRTFASMLQQQPDFELALEPQANIVCFRYRPQGVPQQQLDALNSRIRRKLLEGGDFYIVQTTLHEQVYLRTTLMNPFTTEVELNGLLKEIRTLAHGL